MNGHLPREIPNSKWPDPFENASDEEFEALELDQDKRFLDRLEELWLAGELTYPASVQVDDSPE